MKERPIIFSGPMVRALLDDRKTQARPIVKPKYLWPIRTRADLTEAERKADIDAVMDFCPYGQPGDRLCIKEAWRTGTAADAEPGSALEGKGWPVFYEADGTTNWTGATTGGPGFTTPGRYRHARFMPRWASRITLEITDVRVQRLQEISEEDAAAEGLKRVTKDGELWKWGIPDSDGLPGTDDTGWPWRDWQLLPSLAFSRLWESIHGPDSWDANPLVWAISFRRVEA